MFTQGRFLTAFFVLLVGFESECSEYRWDVTLLTQDNRATPIYSTNDISRDSISIPSHDDDYLPFATLPEDKFQQLTFATSRHLLEIHIQDENNEVSFVMMRHMMLVGLAPMVKVTLLPNSNVTDGGKVEMHLQSILTSISPETSSELSSVKWRCPLPVNEYTTGMLLEIETMDSGSVLIKEFRKTFFVVKHAHLHSATLPAISHPTNNLIQPVLFHFPLTVVALSRMLVFSSTEYKHSVVKQIPNEIPTTEICANIIEIAYAFSDHLIYFSKSGTFWIVAPTAEVKPVIYGSQAICAKHVSVSELLRKIILSTLDATYFLTVPRSNIENFDKATTAVQLVDATGRSILAYVNGSAGEANIVAHSFDNHGGDVLYILLHHITAQKFLLAKYTGQLGSGEWHLLTEIHGKLPIDYTLNENVVLLTSSLTYTGANINIRGISFSQLPDGNVYLWGNVLLAYDIRSGVACVMPLSASTLHLTNDVVVQFVSKKSSSDISLLTESGKLLHGTTFGFERFFRMVENENSVQQLSQVALTNVLGLFYSSFHKLYLLVYDGSTVKRIPVPVNSELPEERYPVILKADCSNITLFSRTQIHTFYTPRVWPSVPQSSQVQQTQHFVARANFRVDTEGLFQAYRAVVHKLTTEQNIGKDFWWHKKHDIVNMWFVNNLGHEKFMEYLSANNLVTYHAWQAYFSMHDYAMDRSTATETCVFPNTIYLDKDAKLVVNFTLLTTTDMLLSAPEQQELLVSLSQSGIVDVKVQRHDGPINTIFEVTLKGCKLMQRPSGNNLQSVGIKIKPWHPTKPTQSVDFIVEGGCPPALSLSFDWDHSVQLLADRGKTDDFQCLYEVSDGVPCFTTSEFVAAFYVSDHITGLRIPFNGNFTLKVIGGGVGYHENIQYYSEEEIKLYNYMPGDSKKLQSLMWTPLDPASTSMQDNDTGQLIFDGRNPWSIVFECRLDSPCGSIPFGVSNPSEFYVVIEVSNYGVDSSTNCDFTTTFEIHLIGIELNAKSHFTIMLVTLGILGACIFIYYQSTDGKGSVYIRGFLRRLKVHVEERQHKPQIKILHAGKESKVSIGSFPSQMLGRKGSQRHSLLTPTLNIDRSVRRRSMAAVENVRRMSMQVQMMPKISLTVHDSDKEIDKSSSGSESP